MTARAIRLLPILPFLALLAACMEVEGELSESPQALWTEPAPEAPEVDVVTRASEVGDIWVDIASPEDGSTIDPGFTIYVAAGPGVLIESVELLIDGEVVATRTTAPYNFPSDASLAGTTHAIGVRATDGAVVADQEITVTVTGDPEPEPDPDPEPDPEPDPDDPAPDPDAPDPEPDSDPTPAPDPEPIDPSLPGACAIDARGAPGAAPLWPLLVALALLARPRRRG